MALHDLHPNPGSRKTRKRKGRGIGSGLGKTSGYGVKGQKARAGGSIRRGFEGGQMPLHRRLPKRGFNNVDFETVYEIVNLSSLAGFPAKAVVDADGLRKAGLVKHVKGAVGLKVLAHGDVSVPLTVRAAKFSAAAQAKIEAAGGRVEVV
jgi:large subunit ribosomal protein L15